MKSEIEIYQRSDRQIEVQVTFDNDTVWLNQYDLGELFFDLDRTVVGRHIKNIFSEKELDENKVCADFAQTTSSRSRLTSEDFEVHLAQY